MPCTAKKHETERAEFRDEAGMYDCDMVITTREFGHLLRWVGSPPPLLAWPRSCLAPLCLAPSAWPAELAAPITEPQGPNCPACLAGQPPGIQTAARWS